MSVAVTPGTGASSVAAELVGGLNYQQIEVYGAGGASTLGISSDGSLKVSVLGSVTVNPHVVGLTSIISMLAPKASIISGVTSVMTQTTPTSVLTAAGTSIKNYITHIICTNAAAVGTFVDIKDGGGNVMYSGYAAASGGGFSSSINPPLVGSANKSVDAAPRTQASVIVAMTGYTDT